MWWERKKKKYLEGAKRTALLKGDGEPVEATRCGTRDLEDVSALATVSAGPGVVRVDRRRRCSSGLFEGGNQRVESLGSFVCWKCVLESVIKMSP